MIVTATEAKEHIGLTEDDEYEDAFILKIATAAQAHTESLLGFKIEETFGGEDQDPIPDDLKMAVLQLTAHWFENREATLVGVAAQSTPIGFEDVVREHREWTW